MNKHICTIVTIVYHLMFLGGTTTLVNGYLDEISALRNEIKTQGDKATKVVDDITKTGKSLDASVKNISKELSKVKKACKRLF